MVGSEVAEGVLQMTCRVVRAARSCSVPSVALPPPLCSGQSGLASRLDLLLGGAVFIFIVGLLQPPDRLVGGEQ